MSTASLESSDSLSFGGCSDFDWVPQLFGRDVALRPDRSNLVDKAFLYWRRRGFPYPAISESEARAELGALGKVRAKDLEHTLAVPSMVGLRLANSFHPQMWSARVRGKSPLECFEHDTTLRACLEKAVRFWPNRRCWSARSVRILASIQNRSRVSNFRPTVARALIDKFSGDGAEILDFSAGYGGRLLGAVSLDRRYVGIDPAAPQCRGLRKMASSLGGDVDILRGCAEDILPSFDDASFDLVFSSPPYFSLEKYTVEISQSYVRYPSYDLWKSKFLNQAIEQSYRLLRNRGYLILNVTDLPRYPIAKDAVTIANSCFGAPMRMYRITMSSNPADKARRGKLLRTEPIIVFQRKK